MSDGWDILGDTLAALAYAPKTTSGKSVGLGSIAIPGTRRYVDQLREFIRQGCQVATPLGPLSIRGIRSDVSRLFLSGTVGEATAWTLHQPIPADWLPLFLSGVYRHGHLELLLPGLALPEMSWNDRTGFAEIRFAQPITVRKAQTAGLFGRRMSWITAQLLGIDLHDTHGDLVFANGFVDWLAPRLRWGD